MGDLVDPKPPQWEHKKPSEDACEDSVTDLAQRLMDTLFAGMEPTVTHLAALRLVQKAVIGNYHMCMGADATRTALAQAKAAADAYRIRGSDGTTEYEF